MDLTGRKRTVRNHVVVSNKSDLIVMTLPAEDEREERPSRTIPLTLLIGGGAAVVTGAGLIAFSPGPTSTDRYYYRTRPPGIAVAAGGVAVAALGAYLLWFRSPPTASTSVASTPVASAPIASFTGDAGYIGWLGTF